MRLDVHKIIQEYARVRKSARNLLLETHGSCRVRLTWQQHGLEPRDVVRALQLWDTRREHQHEERNEQVALASNHIERKARNVAKVVVDGRARPAQHVGVHPRENERRRLALNPELGLEVA